MGIDSLHDLVDVEDHMSPCWAFQKVLTVSSCSLEAGTGSQGAQEGPRCAPALLSQLTST